MKTEGIEPLQLRCPSCGLELGDMPASVPGAVPCGRCGFSITSEGDYWDACVDQSYPRDFARQWVLWEKGRLGDPTLVYGESPEHYFREFLDHVSLRPEELSPKRVLEVGFGHGRLLHRIQEWAGCAYGIDLSKPLGSAHLRAGSAVFGNLLNVPFAPGQFDLVVCRGVIQCTPDPESSFGCVAEQVSGGGMFYLSGCYEPNARGMLVLRKLLPGSWRYPEWLLLGLAGFFGGLRALLEGVRTRDISPAALRRHYAHYKLDVFDVMTPRWSGTLGPETVLPWFASRGFDAKRVGYGSYVGIRVSAPDEE
jgi:SAM-dependent methyltransferase